MNLKGKHAWTAKVGEKGQGVIPREARDLFNIQTGDTLLLLGDESQGIAIITSERFYQFTDALLRSQDFGNVK